MEWYEAEERASRRKRSVLIGLTVLVAVVGASVWMAAVSGVPGAWKRSATLPAAVSRAAQQLGSEVGTSARALIPAAGSLAHAVRTRDTRPHIVPAEGKLVHAKPLRFAFNGTAYTITPHVASNVYWGAKTSTRLLTQFEGESDDSWVRAYYHAFADDPEQRPAIDDVCVQLRAIKAGAHLGQDQYLELIAKYVQSIPYDWAVYKAGTGAQRFPVETLVDCTGLCGDKSVLLADLLSHEGYAVALLDFGPEKHMAVGVLGPGKGYGSTGYLFLETTSPCYVTDVPTEYTGGMHLKSAPRVIPIGSGTLEYSAADQIARIITARESAQKAADRLYNSAKSSDLTDADVTAINRKLAQAFKAETSLRSNVIDQNGRSLGTFMDRSVAEQWITRNAWWM